MLRICIILVLLGFLGCSKDQYVSGPRVAIYLLKSFSLEQNTATNPHSVFITNAVMNEEPFVTNTDINYYTAATTTFHLNRNIQAELRQFQSSQGFAVTVDEVPVYYGKFHPASLSSITFGVATIDPIFVMDKELPIQFATILGNSQLQQFDKRNDPRITNALRATKRLR